MKAGNQVVRTQAPTAQKSTQSQQKTVTKSVSNGNSNEKN
jgi:hypothetical protein